MKESLQQSAIPSEATVNWQKWSSTKPSQKEEKAQKWIPALGFFLEVSSHPKLLSDEERLFWAQDLKREWILEEVIAF